MRGDDRQSDALFSYVSAKQRVPKNHPLRRIRALVDEVLHDMSRELDGLCTPLRWAPSVAENPSMH